MRRYQNRRYNNCEWTGECRLSHIGRLPRLLKCWQNRNWYACVRYSACSRNSPPPDIDSPKSKWHDFQRQINKVGKWIMVNTAFWTILRVCVSVLLSHAVLLNGFRLWPLRRDDNSGVRVGAGEERRSDWPARVLANAVNRRIDRRPPLEEQSIARVSAQVAAT